MDDKTRSLLKKHIRMLDYIRADLVRILGGETPRAPTTPQVLDTGLPISPLYQNFEAAKVLPITDAEGRHLDACKCFGCSAKAIDMAGPYSPPELPAGQVRLAPLIREGMEVCSGCRFPPAECICGAHFPLYGAAHEAPAGAVLVHGMNCPPDCSCRSDPFQALMADIEAAAFRMQDGPPVAYFHLAPSGAISIDHPVGQRFDYQEVKVKGDSRDAVLDDFATLIKTYLSTQTGKGKLILWRVRPELSYEGDHVQGGTRWCAYARLVVVPA